MIYAAALTVHSWLRWLVLLAGVVAFARAAAGASGRKPWKPSDDRAGFWFVTALDAQVLLGVLIMYVFLSPITHAAFGDLGAAMKNPSQRFWVVEHVVWDADRCGAGACRPCPGAQDRLAASSQGGRDLFRACARRDCGLDSLAGHGARPSAPEVVDVLRSVHCEIRVDATLDSLVRSRWLPRRSVRRSHPAAPRPGAR